MQLLDFIVLGAYFAIMIGIGLLCSFTIKKQEDFFMGGRGFGKLMQTFAAFGAGTGSQDPILVGKTTWTSGLSGIWSTLMWLFVTPVYWITAIWYRRMRHLTLGDWFVERYESQAMGAAYTLFAFVFQICYLSIMFAALSKVADPLLGADTIALIVGLIGSDNPADLKYVLIPVFAVVVVLYGVLGGLTAAYWTDLIQGLCIILLSLILIPTGLQTLVATYGDQYVTASGEPVTEMADGFSIMHQRVPSEYFQLAGGPRSGEFPLHYIVSLTVLALVGIVVQPHFIATGGGSAKTENSARIGLVTGNFLKRFCTIGWAVTGLIVLALFASNAEIAADPDRAWGVASREILQPLGFGLVGLMLACLLAAMMSSADCYMLISSALIVRNVFAPYVNSNATEKQYVNVGRFAGILIIGCAAGMAIAFYNVLEQFKLALEVAILFGAPFWVGMWWRGATKWAAWGTLLFSLSVFFILPAALPFFMPSLRENPEYAISNHLVTTTITRTARLADVDKRQAQIAAWDAASKRQREQSEEATTRYTAAQSAVTRGETDGGRATADAYEELAAASTQLAEVQAKVGKLGPRPAPVKFGEEFRESFKTGGASIFWSGGVAPVKGETVKLRKVSSRPAGDGQPEVLIEEKAGKMQGAGVFRLDFLLYHLAGYDLRQADNALLQTLRLPPRLVLPFVVMILLSLVTPRNSKAALDRYYVKMKTPVRGDAEEDAAELAASYANPDRFNNKRLLPFFGLEIQRPTLYDSLGFVVCVIICFAFLAFAYWLANLGYFPG